MKQMFDFEINSDRGRMNYSRPRISPKDEEGSIIPRSKIDDYQTSISNFSTRNESDKNVIKKAKKHVTFNPFINVINIESYKKETYESQNEELTNKEKKCILCSIFWWRFRDFVFINYCLNIKIYFFIINIEILSDEDEDDDFNNI